MAENATRRKLTAILSADVKGYSKLMGDDDESTVNTITAYRKIVSELIRKHQGRVVDTPGDNILAEFGSALNAVIGAVEIQRTLETENGRLPDNRRMEFRIGINLGDILHKDNCIYGDGVNIAARIESLADPGGICISRGVFDQVKRQIRQGFEYLGEHTVKNIPEPVRIYRILLAPEDEGKLIGEPNRSTKKSKQTFTFAVAVILICSAAILWMFFPKAPEIDPTSKEKMKYPLPDKPSIAVLPFVNMSDDPNQEYFSDGLTEEIIAALASVPKLFVIARNSTFTYKGKPVKVQQVSEDLGVHYVLEGSVRKAGDRIRITAQLIDALNGHHLWAKSYEQNLSDIFAVQDKITKNIITAMQVKLTEGEEARVAAKGTNKLQAYLNYLQANELINQLNSDSNALAKQLAEEALVLDPEYASAYYLLSGAYIMDVFLGTSKSPKQSISKAIEFSQKAIELDDTFAVAQGLLGFLYSMTEQHDKAIVQGEKAVALNPNSAECHYRLGKILSFAGKWKKSIPEYERAIRLNPIPPNKYIWSLGLAYGFTGQHEEAIKWCEKAVHQEPNDLLANLMMTQVYHWSGRDEKAREQAVNVLKIQPNFSLKKWEKKVTYKEISDRDKILNALRKAGLPE